MDELDARLEFQRLGTLRGTGLLGSLRLPDLDEICRQAKEHFRVATALVTLIDKEVQLIKASTGSTAKVTPRSSTLCDHTIRSDTVLVVTDAIKDLRFAPNPFVMGEPFIRFYAGAPLIYRRRGFS